MEIKLLPKSVRETLRSEVNFRSVAKCLAQLVYNSLDAKATSIAVRINLITFKIQVIDNGTGISKHNLKIIGFRYATSKYYTVEDLEKNPNVFPSRGECLSSIIKLSETFKITTRYLDNQKTYCKTFENGKCLPISSVKQRPSKGTTISIENFMYNLPVRKKSINQNLCLDEIKTEIENIALMHPNTTFSLRNDSNGEIIFHTLRTKYVFQTAAILYGKDFSRRLRKVCHNDGNFSVSGLISLDSHYHNRKQFIYINHRLVSKTKIHELINKIISRSKIMTNKEFTYSPVKQKHAAFIINIKCSYLELDIVDFIEPEIEFKNWETVLSCVQDALTDFLKKYDLLVTKESNKNRYQNGTPLSESTPKVRTSQIDGVIRGITMKRKLSEEKIEQTLSSPKTINSEERKILNISHKKLTPETISSISKIDKLSSPPLKKVCSRLGKRNDNTLEEKNKKGRRKKQNISKQVKKQNISNKTNKNETISLEQYKILNITKGKNKTNFFTNNFDSPPRKQMKTNNLETNECLNGMMNKVLKKVNKETNEENVNVTNSANQNFVSLNLPPSKMNKETYGQNLNVTLESKSDSGKQLILDKFLKSTAIFRTDDELDQHYLSFESAEKYTNRSASSCFISSLQHCKTTSTSTKISITKTIEHNININKNNHINNDENIFKIPEIPQWRKRKSNCNNLSDNVSNILAHFKSSSKIDMKPRQKNVDSKNFEVDFIKNISKRNSLPPNLSNHFLKILDNIKKGPNNKKYECTIKITKRLNYLQSSDFLKPAKKLNRKYDLQNQKCKNVGLKKHKEIVHSNSMLKTFFDLKYDYSFHKPKNYKNYHMDKYKFSYFLPNINRNYLTHKNDNIEPLSCSLKKEISNLVPNTWQKESTNIYLPIYNIKRSKTQKYNFEPSKIYKNTQNFVKNHENSLSFPSSVLSFKPYSTHLELDKRSNEVYCNIIDKTVKENRTNINFPSPILSFKPYNSNPHLEKHFSKQKLFPKSDFAFSKANFNFNDPSLNNKNSSDVKSLYSFIPTYDSHQMAKESIIQHKNESKNVLKDTDTLIEKAVEYFKINNSNLLQLQNTKVTKKTESSNLTFLSEEKEVPETPEKVENVQNKMTENNSKETNCEQPKRNMKKTPISLISKDKYYDRNNITKWIDCTINNTPFFEIQQNHNVKIDNINKNLQNHSSSEIIKDSEYFKKDMNKSMKKNKMENKNLQKDTANNNNNIMQTKKITKEKENNNKKLNETCKFKNINTNNKSSYQLLNQMNIKTKETPNIYSFISPYKSTMDESNKNLKTTNKNDNNLLNLTQYSSKSIDESKKEFTFLPFLEKPKNAFNNLQYNFANMENRSSSNLTVILSSEEKGNSEQNKIPVSFLSFLNKPENIDNNPADNSTQIRISQEKQKSQKESSPILFSFNSDPISGIPNDVKTNQNLSIEFDEAKLLTKDQSYISLSNFSSNSNMIQDKDVTNIISILDQSIIINDIKQPENNIRNLQSPDSKKNTETLFPEDNTNIVSENNRNIDEKLNNSCSNEQVCKSYEIINNSLSKNSEKSKEINQIVTENVNGMPEWRKQTSDDGNSYYINIRTGMTSYLTPKEVEGCTIMKRPAYIPKGMSPILVKSKAVTKELSQNSKNVLHKCIANTENDELQTVKWVNYFENKDSEQFFSDLYTNIKNYESEIPNLNNYTIPKKIIKGFENYSFSKEDFDKITVINQCDNKFIVTKMEIQGKYDLLVLFDQHAVHERIRLEKLLKDYEEKENKLKSVKCHVPIHFNLDKFEIKMFQNYKQYFENWGFNYEIENKNIKFTHIPSCWQTKDDSNIKNKDYSAIESLLRNLIQEESNWIKDVRRINVALPLVIQNSIKTEACRTAIKFGDPLTKEQCENLMKQLFSCDLPFNCAHGRPTLFPVIDLNHLNNEEEDEINLNNLRS